jgi:uncharacterized iron-regulated protein
MAYPQSTSRRSFVRALALAPLAVSGARGAGAAQPPAEHERALLLDHPLAGRVWDAASGAFVTRAALIDRLRRAHFRLIGEVHDNPEHHRVQAELLEGVVREGLAPTLVFEQMDREHDAALQQRLAGGGAGVEDVAEAVRFDRKGWNWDFYRPLVAIGLKRGLPLRAGNLSRGGAGAVVKKGLAVLEPARRAALRLEESWNSEREEALREIIRDGHCGALPESIVPNMAAAQRVRDATIAEAMLAAGGDGAVLIAGNGHVRRDLAVPLYLAASAPERASCAIGILEVEAGHVEPRAYLQAAASTDPIYDAVIFTPRWQRPDPCAAFERKP